MAENTVTSQHTVEGTVELPDSAGHMIEVGYKASINPWGDTCMLTYPDDACLGDDENEINDAAMEMAYEDAYAKVREESAGEVNAEHAARYQLLLDRLDGEKTEHGECRVAKRLEALEKAVAALMGACKRYLDQYDSVTGGTDWSQTPATIRRAYAEASEAVGGAK